MINTKIPLYGIFILLSLIVNVIIVYLKYNHEKFTKEEIIGAICFENIGIICGAKLLFFLENFSIYKHNLNVLSWGFSSYGGVLGAVLMLEVFAISFKKDKKEMLLNFSLPLPLVYGIGKIGCFFAGCCGGIEYNGIFNIVYNYSYLTRINGMHLFPIQLVEAITFICIFLLIRRNYSLKKMGLNLILCGFFKFSLEFLRQSHIGKIITFSQIISLIIILVGIIIYTKYHNSDIIFSDKRSEKK